MHKFNLAALAGALLLWHTAAVQAQATGSQAPTFEEVMAAPDDPVLNTAYAKAQIAAGNYIFAAAAYERLLLQQPDDDATRVAYVQVLLNLDDRVTAGHEIAKLNSVTLKAEQQATVAALQTRLAARSVGGRK